MQRFQYKFVMEDETGPHSRSTSSGQELVENCLNEYAKDGWRVIYFQATSFGLAFVALLERPYQESEDC
jgi:hypothetical protein